MATIPRVSPAEAKALVDEQGYTYLDVRSVPEYAAGHPAGARNVPLMDAGARGLVQNPDFVAIVTAIYAKDAKLVLGCRSGQRSLRAAELLAAAGFTAVTDQRAGFEGVRNAFGQLSEPGWATVGLPVETDTPGASYAELRQKAGK